MAHRIAPQGRPGRDAASGKLQRLNRGSVGVLACWRYVIRPQAAINPLFPLEISWATAYCWPCIHTVPASFERRAVSQSSVLLLFLSSFRPSATNSTPFPNPIAHNERGPRARRRSSDSPFLLSHTSANHGRHARIRTAPDCHPKVRPDPLHPPFAILPEPAPQSPQPPN